MTMMMKMMMMMEMTIMAMITALMMMIVKDVDERPLQLAHVGQVWNGSPLL